MKVLGHIAITYVGDFFYESLMSVRDIVDKFHIVYSQTPSHGFNSNVENPDREYAIRKIAFDVLGKKLIWETYSGFNNEYEHRKTRYKHSEGFDLILTIDPDEIHNPWYTKDVLEAIYKAPAYNNSPTERFYGIDGFIHFWKGTDWCFTQDGDKPIRIEDLRADNQDLAYFEMPIYHMSMVQREEIIRYKMSVYGHKNEIKPGYLDKYLTWTPEKIDEITHLHPTRDDIWIKPEPFTGALPELLKNHKKQQITDMKILFIPMDFHRHAEGPELFQDQLEGLQSQAPTMIFTTMSEAIAFKPTVILYQASLSVGECMALKSSTGAKLFMYTGDATDLPPQSFVEMKEVVDAYLVPFSGRTADIYSSLLDGKPCHFLWEPIQNWRFKPNKQMLDGNITFVGNHYNHLPGGIHRIEDLLFLHHMGYKKNDQLWIYGNIPMKDVHLCNYDETPALYNEAFIVICSNNYTKDDYFTPRNLGAMAAGSCALMREFPGIEKHFNNLTDCIFYKDKYELLSWIQYLKKNPDFRNHIADYGFKKANEAYTTKHWAQAFTNIIKTHYQ